MSTGPSAPPLRPDTGPLNIPGSAGPVPSTPVKEEEDRIIMFLFYLQCVNRS